MRVTPGATGRLNAITLGRIATDNMPLAWVGKTVNALRIIFDLYIVELVYDMSKQVSL